MTYPDHPDFRHDFSKENPAPNSPGVYFIFEGDHIVYVGKSINLKQRLAYHPHSLPSRKFSFIEFDYELIDDAEKHYIKLKKPTLNRNIVDAGKVSCRYMIDDKIRIKINIMAAMEDISPSSLVEKAVDLYVDTHNSKLPPNPTS
jgi:hypothetical protein